MKYLLDLSKKKIKFMKKVTYSSYSNSLSDLVVINEISNLNFFHELYFQLWYFGTKIVLQ